MSPGIGGTDGIHNERLSALHRFLVEILKCRGGLLKNDPAKQPVNTTVCSLISGSNRTAYATASNTHGFRETRIVILQHLQSQNCTAI